jgi:hypothetical protein
MGSGRARYHRDRLGLGTTLRASGLLQRWFLECLPWRELCARDVIRLHTESPYETRSVFFLKNDLSLMSYVLSLMSYLKTSYLKTCVLYTLCILILYTVV